MPISLDTFPHTATVGGAVSAAEMESLAQNVRLKCIQLRSDAPRETWKSLNDHILQSRPDMVLAVDSFWPGGADLSLLRFVPDVRRLCLASSGTEKLLSLESIGMLPLLESLQIGSPSLESFDVLTVLTPDRIRNLRLADTQPRKLSLRVLERFTGLQSLRIEGHTVDLDAVRSIRSLRQLCLSAVRLKDLCLLQSLPNLVSFTFHSSTVKTPEALAELISLRHLDLYPSSGFPSVDFLATMCGLEMLELGQMPKLRSFPNLSRLSSLRRVSIYNLKRLEALDGLAQAPGLYAYHHCAVPAHWTPEHFRCLLEHSALQQFTAIIGTPKKDDLIREFAAQFGKMPVHVNTDNPFEFML